MEYIAKLARLKLTPCEKELFAKQLGEIITYFDKLQEIDTDGIEPTSHVMSITNIFKEDEVWESLSIDEVLQDAPDHDGSFFRVPKIIE